MRSVVAQRGKGCSLLSSSALVLGAALGCTPGHPADEPATPNDDTTDSAGDDDTSAAPAAWRCPEGEGVELALVDDPRVVETSGIVAVGDVLWAHNDSGDGPRLLGLGWDGVVRAEVTLDGVTARDWEDIAAYSHEGQPRLVVGDLGDNARARGDVRLHVLEAPVGHADATVTPLATVELRYPEGKGHDAEALLVTPDGAETCVVTKTLDPVALVMCTGSPDAPSELRQVGTLDVRLDSDDEVSVFTAGDVSDDGRLVALRSYGLVRIWERLPGATLAETLTSPTDCVFRPELELQGEAIAFEPGGDALLTLAEGTPRPIWRYPLK